MSPGSLDGPGGDAALFIDWENFKYSLYEVGQVPDLTALMQAVRERCGRPTLARAYADWQDYYHRKSFDQMTLYSAGIEPVYVPSRRSPSQQSRIKNSVDVRLSLDCMEASFTHPHVQTFVLVAGDADYLHVVSALRRRGGRVVMIGVSGSTSQRLSAVVDDLIFYDRDIAGPPLDIPAPEEPSDHAEAVPPASIPVFLPMPPPPTLPPVANHTNGKTDAQKVETEAATQALEELVRRQREQEGGRNYPPLLSWLQMQMRDHPPYFVPQKYGFDRFKDFVLQAERAGLVKVQTADLTDRVWLAEDAAEMEREAARLSSPIPEPDDSWRQDEALVEQHDEFADIVLTGDDIENSHREYMGRSLLARFLYNKGHWDPANLPARAAPPRSAIWRTSEMPDIYRLVDNAIDRGILIRAPYVDVRGVEVTAVELSRTHPFVRHVLSTAAL